MRNALVKQSSVDLHHVISTGSATSAVAPEPIERPPPSHQYAAATTVGVVGAGIMGHAIAQCCAQAGIDVVCCDTSQEALDDARIAIDEGRFGLRQAVERGQLTAEEAEAVRRRIVVTTDLEQLVTAHLVIEAAPEELDLKIRLFRSLASMCRRDAVLASNTSGLPIIALAAATDVPERVAGWHWASPAQVMPFAEIVATPETSEATLGLLVATARRCGKDPVVVRDNPHAWGFVANRIYFTMVREARRVVEEGIACAEDVDRLMVNCFNWPVGPLEIVDHARRGWDHAL